MTRLLLDGLGISHDAEQVVRGVPALLDRLGVPARLLDRRPGAVSGGEVQRLALARVLATRPAFLVADEPALGERQHLMSRDISIETFIVDMCEVIDCEELSDVVLVGHSFGGITITGIADRRPEQLRHLVYLDSRILENGQSMMDVDAARSGEWRRIAQETSGGLSIPPPPASYFGVPDPADTAWIALRLTPHPLGTFTTPLQLTNPRVGNGLPCTYIACVDPTYPWIKDCRDWARGRSGWSWREIAAGYDAMISAPEILADLLIDIAM